MMNKNTVFISISDKIRLIKLKACVSVCLSVHIQEDKGIEDACPRYKKRGKLQFFLKLLDLM